jgi:acetyl-CoA synthetase
MATQLSQEQLVHCGLDAHTAAEWQWTINHWLASLKSEECWRSLTQKFLEPDHPFALHQLLYQATFADGEESQRPAPAWFPSDSQIRATHIADVMQALQIQSYPELHQWSVQHRAEFWQTMIQRLGIHFHKSYTEILNLDQGVEAPYWLVNARLNIAESCFQAPAEHPAILFQSEGGSLTTVTYGELQAFANRVANGLMNVGFQPGDAIAIDMPMTIEAVAIYLGIILAGGVVVSIADSFAANEIATRLRIAHPKAIFTQDFIVRGGKQLPLYAKVVEAQAPMAIVIASNPLQSLQLRLGDCSWHTFLSPIDQFTAIPTLPTAHTNILFSSGTTGEPKAIPWTQITPIKCAVDGHLHHDIHADDVVAWPTNLGWMMGPWLIYAALINRATMVLYDGAPTTRAFGQFVQDTGVTILGVVPSLVSVWKSSNCLQGLDWHRIKAFSSTGECSNPPDMLFLMSRAGYRPIIEYCGGTEIGGGYLTGTLVQPSVPATFTTPALGLDLVILDEGGQLAEKGEVFILPPSIGLSTELLNCDHHQVYFANAPLLPIQTSSSLPMKLRCHGDQMERLPDGYYRAHGRVDDTMNLNGIKVSAVELEQVINGGVGVRESAAIALAPTDGGPSQLVVYVVLEPGYAIAEETLRKSLQDRIRQYLNPLFKIHDLSIVASLPRTASNKVMRRLLRQNAVSRLEKATRSKVLPW